MKVNKLNMSLTYFRCYRGDFKNTENFTEALDSEKDDESVEGIDCTIFQSVNKKLSIWNMRQVLTSTTSITSTTKILSSTSFVKGCYKEILSVAVVQLLLHSKI